MSLKEEIEKMKYDQRLVGWNIKNHFISEEDYKSHLSQLQDKTHLSETLSFDSDSKEESEVEDASEKTLNEVELTKKTQEEEQENKI